MCCAIMRSAEEDKYRVSTNNWDQSSWREKSTYASTQYGSKYSSNYRKTLEPKQNVSSIFYHICNAHLIQWIYRNITNVSRSIYSQGSCNFCLNNNMLDYQSHTLKTNDGRVTCPRLRSYRCPLCGVSGDKAHTIKYCPSRSSSRHWSIYRSRQYIIHINHS